MGSTIPNFLLSGPGWSSNRNSGLYYILPYIDQSQLFNAINSSFCNSDGPSAFIAENQTAKSTTIGAYLCPSDANSPRLNNYRFNYGCNPQPQARPDGPFCIGVMTSPASVTDGLSNTAFVSERVGGSFAPNGHDPFRDLKAVPVPGGYYTIDQEFIAHCVSLPNPDWVPDEGRYWMFNGMENGDYNHNGTPNDQRTSCGGTDYGLHPPRSLHASCVNVLFGDGRVEAIAESINQSVWRAIGTHASGD